MPVERVTRTIRLPADLAAEVDQAAENTDQSVNRWIIGAVRARLLTPFTVTTTGGYLHPFDMNHPDNRPAPLVCTEDGCLADAVIAPSSDYAPVWCILHDPARNVRTDPRIPARAPNAGQPIGPRRPVGSFDPDTDGAA